MADDLIDDSLKAILGDGAGGALIVTKSKKRKVVKAPVSTSSRCTLTSPPHSSSMSLNSSCHRNPNRWSKSAKRSASCSSSNRKSVRRRKAALR